MAVEDEATEQQLSALDWLEALDDLVESFVIDVVAGDYE